MGNSGSQYATTEQSEQVTTKSSSQVFPEALSEFYQACRWNRIKDVKHLLQTATLTDINRIEPHGSTALHAAAYYGHTEIVQLLLDKGAIRTIRNKYGCTPYEEAQTPEIERLFERASKANRFGGSTASMEWILVDPAASRNACKYKQNEAMWFADVCSNSGQLFLVDIKRYVNANLAHIKGANEICFFIDQATREKSVEPVLKAYTAETGFYNAINAELASINTVSFAKNDDETTRDEYFRYWHGPGGYAAIIAHHPHFFQYEFIGTAYRGMNMSDDDISMYKVNTLLVNKAFLSASIERKVAEKFAIEHPLRHNNQSGILIKYPTLCKYLIRHKRTAFYIEKISEYPTEKEVLITPRAAFRVISIKKRLWIGDQIMIRIKLHECDLNNDIDSTDSNEFEDDRH